MKAIVSAKYGSPDVLQLREVKKPVPAKNEVLIKVHAASINPLDWHFMRGTPRLMRIGMGLFNPKIKILGADVAGVVEAVGKDVTEFRPGDSVLGELSQCGLGALAAYVCAPEKVLVAKPVNTTWEEAAAVPVAAITALQSLRKGQLKPNQQVLINGASGGVGSFTVQIAKAMGAVVTGVCSTRNLDLVRSLGADHVIDYRREDFVRAAIDGGRYDLLVDNVGNKTIADYKAVLKPRGTCVVVGYTSNSLLIHHMFKGPWASATGKQKIGLMGSAKTNKKDMSSLKELIEAGKVKAVIDRRYTLSEVPEAMRYLEKGHARGKLVIVM